MKKILSFFCVISMIVGSTGAAVSTAEAAPANFAKPKPESSVHNVQFRRDDGPNRVERRGSDRSRLDRRVERPRFERRGGFSYYNGHRGYREHRRGYRQYNGYWFPPAAFVAGAILGGALANQPTVAAPPVYAPVRLSAAHVNWCQNRWKSYRVSDNSYQPNNGPRQACVSP